MYKLTIDEKKVIKEQGFKGIRQMLKIRVKKVAQNLREIKAKARQNDSSAQYQLSQEKLNARILNVTYGLLLGHDYAAIEASPRTVGVYPTPGVLFTMVEEQLAIFGFVGVLEKLEGEKLNYRITKEGLEQFRGKKEVAEVPAE